jgi:transcriptional regulator with XRE-family HTH domain
MAPIRKKEIPDQSLSAHVAMRLREARFLACMTQNEAAGEMRKQLPISRNSLTHYESGTHRISLDVLAALAKIYGRPVSWFFIGYKPEATTEGGIPSHYEWIP